MSHSWRRSLQEGRRIQTPGVCRDSIKRGSFEKLVSSENYPMRQDSFSIPLYMTAICNHGFGRCGIARSPFSHFICQCLLQQCADSVMRMYAEYYHTQHTRQYGKIVFHFCQRVSVDYPDEGTRKFDDSTVQNGKFRSTYNLTPEPRKLSLPLPSSFQHLVGGGITPPPTSATIGSGIFSEVPATLWWMTDVCAQREMRREKAFPAGPAGDYMPANSLCP